MSIKHENGTEEFVGAVLCDREENWHDDSDFYALVWNGTAIEKVYHSSTRYGGGSQCTVDATPEVRELAGAWTREKAALKWLDAMKYECKRIVAGANAKIVAGRKIPLGEHVEVVRTMPSQFNRWDVVALVRRIDGRHTWTNVKNLERTNVVEPTIEQAREAVAHVTASYAPALFSRCALVA